MATPEVKQEMTTVKKKCEHNWVRDVYEEESEICTICGETND